MNAKPLLQALCEIHNRLTDIAVTLQTIGTYMCQDEAGKQKFRELLQRQRGTYANVSFDDA